MSTRRSLRQLREHRFLTQRQLADALGTHVNTVSRWEQGENRLPRLPLFKQLCAFFGVGPDDIIFATKDEPKGSQATEGTGETQSRRAA
jgi:transcriptional regulator with XRE-family HTH domain